MKHRLSRVLLSSVLTATLTATGLPLAFSAAAADREAIPGIWAEYYSDEGFTAYSASALEKTVDHVWDENNMPVGQNDLEFFSVRWLGQILAPDSGNYTIFANVDDGAKVYIDGELVIDDAGPHLPVESSASFNWRAGTYHTIRIDYYNGELGGTMQLKWQTPSGEKESIPEECLYQLSEDYIDIDWKIENGTISAVAHLYREDQTQYNAVIEVYNDAGEKVDESTAARGTGKPQVWQSEAVDYLEGYTYKAYVSNLEGAAVSDILEKDYSADAYLTVDASNVTGRVSPYLYGSCMEDVNHELYGGIWSQMVFGESFAEPAANLAPGFTPAGGAWEITKDAEFGNIITVAQQNDGPKLVLDNTDCESGEFSADIYFEGEGPVGFIVKTSNAGAGADNFYGYEVGLQNGSVKVARHENNYDANSVKTYNCNAKPGAWVNLKVVTTRDNIAVYVDGVKVGDYATAASVTSGAMAFRAWAGSGKYKNIIFKKDGGQEQAIEIPDAAAAVSGMWEKVERDTAVGAFDLDSSEPYTKNLTASGAQSQKITFQSGEGAVGVNNMGLNRKGMNFEAEKEYEGYFYARSGAGAKAYVVLESADGSQKYAETEAIAIDAGNGWKKYAFQLTPDTKDAAGRMTIELREAGTMDLGYVFLQPGEWGRYKGLPVRRDVGEALEEQNLSIMRFGGCMANASDYKWKHMLGAPEDRPTYTGWWYPYSSLGFGIIEFLDLCEALGIVGVPDFNSYESAQDMADFMDFATGTDENNIWVQKRIEMGHPEPYNIPYLQFGNEEKVDEVYAARFNAVAPAIWEKSDDIVLIVGDFSYNDVIHDPYNFTGAHSGITSLNGHKSMLELAQQHGRDIWFDIHFWTETIDNCESFYDILKSIYDGFQVVCPGTTAKLVVFEYNANAHHMNRALGNAFATTIIEKNSDIFALVCSANALQVDGHNDNGWDQGLVFMNNDSVWLQPPAYVTQMAHAGYQPNLVSADLKNTLDDFYYSASSSEDGNTLSLKLVNNTPRAINLEASLADFTGNSNSVKITTLSADKVNDTNTAENPEKILPKTQTIKNGVQDNKMLVTLPARSYTVVEVVRNSTPGSQTLADAQVAVEKAVQGITASNAATASDYMAAAKTVVTNADIQIIWAEDFVLTEATPNAEGSITGKLQLKLGIDTAEVKIEAVIPRLTSEILPGDLDKDGKVTIADVMEACKVLARKSADIDPTADEIARGDLDGDKDVTIADVMEICKNLAREN